MNVVYPLAAQHALNGGDLFPDVPSIVALDPTYSYSSGDEFFDALSGQVGDVIALGSPDFTDGVLTASNPMITSLSPGDNITSFVVFNDTGTPSTSRIVGFADTDSFGSPINFTSDGSNLPVTFPGVTIVSI